MTLNLNQVFLAGRLTRDVELKFVGPNGDRALASIGLAMNRRWKDKEGVAHEEATFVDVTAWGKSAELAAQYLTKGSECFIEGRLKMDEWKTKEGQKRQMMKVEADSIQFLTPRRDAETRSYERDEAPALKLPPAPPATKAPRRDFDDEPPF